MPAPRSGFARNASGVLLAVLIVLCGGLFALLVHQPRPTARGERLTLERLATHETPAREGVVRGEATGGHAARDTDTNEHLTYARARVTDETGRRLQGAVVSVFRDMPAAESLAVAPPSSVIDRAITDAEGECILPRASGGEGYTAHAYKDGYAVAEQPLQSENTLALSRGESIRGMVTDGGGRPLEGVLVCARDVRLPSARDSWCWPPRKGFGLGKALTDADGRFALEGLVDALYQLSAWKDGWVEVASAPGHSRKARPSPPLRPSTRQVPELQMVAVRHFRVQLVDSTLGVGIHSHHVAVAVVGSESVHPCARLLPTMALAGDVVQSIAGLVGSSGEFTGMAVLREAANAPATARIIVQAEGYIPGWADVPLDSPGVAGRREGTTSVALVPSHPGGGQVRVSTAREAPGIWRADWRTLFLPDIPLTLRGVRLGGDLWEFDGIPTGSHRATFSDGLSDSLEANVSVPQQLSPLAVEWPPISGIALVLRDTEGTRLFNADFVGLHSNDDPTQRVRALDPLVTSLEVDPASGVPRERLIAVKAGRWRLLVRKSGYAPSAVDVEATSDRVTPVTLQLAENR